MDELGGINKVSSSDWILNCFYHTMFLFFSFQDLVGKLKDATKCLDKLAQS